MTNAIEYCGTIDHLDGQRAYVRITPQDSCTGCKVQAMCLTARGKEQMIEALNRPEEPFAENEQVLVCGKESMARLAVGLSFVVPLVLVVSVIFVTIGLLGWEESAGALAGLAVPAPWYLGLYLLRNALKKKIVFTVKKIKQPVI